MVPNAKIREIVIDSLKKHQINNGDFLNLKPKLQEQLIQIEHYIYSSVLKQQQLLEEIKNTNLNVLTVVKGSGLQRSSVYNHADILKKYIEVRIKEVEKEDILSLNKSNKQKEELQILKEYMDNLQNNLIDNEILESKNDELEKEVLRLNKIQESLIKEMNDLKKENKELKIKAKNNGNSIVELKVSQ